MHSSRMPTVRCSGLHALGRGGCIPACTGQGVCVSQHALGRECVSQHALGRGLCIPACTGQGFVCRGCVCPWGCLPRGMCLQGGVCPGGCLPRGCVSQHALGRGSAWGVCPGGCMLGVSAWGCVSAQGVPDTPSPCEQND